MEIKRIISGPLYNNCYIAYDKKSKDAIIIDTPEEVAEKALNFLKEQQLKVHYIINTHGHFDHIYENAKLKDATGAKIACHQADEGMLEDPQPKFAKNFRLIPTKADMFVKEGDELKVGEFAFKVLHTPGHTPGSICLYNEKEKILFTGDTLFKGTFGRTDLWGGNDEQMKKTLKRLATLPKDVRVLPGHDEETIIGNELAWLNDF